MESHWLGKHVSLYRTHSDNIRRPASFSEVLLSSFGSNIREIYALRQLDIHEPQYKEKSLKLKDNLQCFALAASLGCKVKGNVTVTERTEIMQLDFDYKDIKEYDVEELKKAVFSLPFIAFC